MARQLRRRVINLLPESTLRRLQRARHRESLSLERPAARSAPRGVTPTVVTEFDAHAVRANVVATISRALDAAKIAYVLVPGHHSTVRQIGVSEADRHRAMRALDSVGATAGWASTPRGAARRLAPVVRLDRVLAAPGGQFLSGDTSCEIAFWAVVGPHGMPRSDGEPHTTGTHIAPADNQVASYLSGPAWEAATVSPEHWPDACPDIFEMREPIDIVYTWVDGADPTWLARKAVYAPGEGVHNVSATHAARFLSRDELRYSLRSVSMYASWVRRIFIVTDGQVPPWLDTSNPKIVIVDHQDIFSDTDVLPVFNSHAIESQLHHIDGLSEHYLYLNDDMFFGRPVEPELFFQGNGIATFFLGKGGIDLDPASARDLPVMSAAKNQRMLLQRDFGVTALRKFKHVAHPQHRSVVHEMEERYPKLFAQVAASRFRHPDDLSIASSLIHYFSYAHGCAVPGDIHYRYQDIARPDTARRLDEILRERPQMFCLNDLASDSAMWDEQENALRSFFNEYYPLPGTFERRT